MKNVICFQKKRALKFNILTRVNNDSANFKLRKQMYKLFKKKKFYSSETLKKLNNFRSKCLRKNTSKIEILFKILLLKGLRM